ncbi:MAG: hypothetical protein K8S55_03670 [Phycisphaerae bacterium]|nr:hypothetical protein [Phycisphaerae bacterium]
MKLKIEVMMSILLGCVLMCGTVSTAADKAQNPDVKSKAKGAAKRVKTVKGTPSQKGDVILLDETSSIRKWKNVEPSKKQVKSGDVSGLWANHPKKDAIHIRNIPHDWSGYRALSFWLYSEVANNARVILTVASDNKKSKGWDYYLYRMRIDWRGWKKFEIPMSEFSSRRTPAGWNKIDNVSFTAKWGVVAKPRADTVLYFDKMKLIKTPEKRITFMRRIKPCTFYRLSIVKSGGAAIVKVSWLDDKMNRLKSRSQSLFFPNRNTGQYHEFSGSAASFSLNATWAEVTIANAPDVSMKEIRFVEDKTFATRSAAGVARDCQTMKQRFLALYALSGITADKQQAHDLREFRNGGVRKSDTRVEELMKTQIMDPKAKGFGSWGKVKDINHTLISYDAQYFLEPLRLARAYVNPYSKYHKNPEVLKRIHASLNFGKQFIRVGGPRPWNWWAWDIGIPLRLSETLLLVGDKLDGKLYRELIADLYDLGYNPKEGGFAKIKGASGANALWVARCALNLGILEKDQKLLQFARKIFQRVNVFTTINGIQADGSYLFHGSGLNMGYGFAHLSETAVYLYITADTGYCLDRKSLAAYMKFFNDFAVWNVYRGRVSPYTVGRTIARGSIFSGVIVAEVGLYLLASEIKKIEQDAIATVADWEKGRSESVSSLKPDIFYLRTKLRDKLADATPPLIGTRFYLYSDYFIARNGNFFCAVRMSSTRTKGWFSIGNENLRGHYSGEGTLVLMTDGREYEPDTIITQPWDDLSGITRVIGLRPPRESLGQSTFVGGIELGDVGLCGMEYLLSAKGKKLQASKSYFAMKNVLVVLGADIKATGTDTPTETMLLTLPVQKGDGNYYLNGEKKTFADGTNVLKNTKSFYYRNIGVLFPSRNPTSLKIETRTKNHFWINQQPQYRDKPELTRQFFSLQVNHGVNPTDGKYAAVILPAWKLADVVAAAKTSPVKIVRNNKDIQAVKYADGSCAAGVFFKAGNCKIGGLSRSGYLAWKKDGGKISAAVFMSQAGKVTVTLPFAIDKTHLQKSITCQSVDKGCSVITLTAPARTQVNLTLSKTDE